jgi:hypothetical protein
MKWLLLQLNPRSEIKGNYCLRESRRLENFREAPFLGSLPRCRLF